MKPKIFVEYFQHYMFTAHKHVYHMHVCLLPWATFKIKGKYASTAVRQVDTFVVLRDKIKWHEKSQRFSIVNTTIFSVNVWDGTNIPGCVFYISLPYLLILLAILKVLFFKIKYDLGYVSVYINIHNSPFGSNYDLICQKEQTKMKKTTMTTTKSAKVNYSQWLLSCCLCLCDFSFWKAFLKPVCCTLISTDWEIFKNYVLSSLILLFGCESLRFCYKSLLTQSYLYHCWLSRHIRQS